MDYPDCAKESGDSRIHQFLSGMTLEIGYSSKIIHDGIETLPVEFVTDSNRMDLHKVFCQILIKGSTTAENC